MFLRFLLITFPLAGVIFWYTLRLTPKDQELFTKLLQESLELRTRHALEEKPALQKRQHVQKDIWTQDELRHLEIKSEESDLTISQNKEKTEAVEKLKKIHGNIDNEFTLTADVGIYTFSSHQFIARENCEITQNENRINGSRIDLDLTHEILHYENPKGHLASGPVDFEAKKLTWDKKENRLFLTENVVIKKPEEFTILANEGILNLENLKPTLITLSGNVRLISSKIQDKESFALADTLVYNPNDQTLLFSREKRVLFWQEGLSLSASEILIRKDRTVEGLGDVHFSFDFEEQNFINQLFEKYL